MRALVLAIITSVMSVGAARSCDDHHGACEIEDWTYFHTGMMEALQIDWVTTCDTGVIGHRLYDGEGDAKKFIGVESAYFRGHAFQAIELMVAKPTAFSIK